MDVELNEFLDSGIIAKILFIEIQGPSYWQGSFFFENVDGKEFSSTPFRHSISAEKFPLFSQ